MIVTIKFQKIDSSKDSFYEAMNYIHNEFIYYYKEAKKVKWSSDENSLLFEVPRSSLPTFIKQVAHIFFAVPNKMIGDVGSGDEGTYVKYNVKPISIEVIPSPEDD